MSINRESIASTQQCITRYFPSLSGKQYPNKSFRPDVLFDQFHSQIPEITDPRYPTVRFARHGIKLVYFPREDHYAVYTNKDISTGTILAIEEATVGRRSDLVLFLEQNPELGRDIYPRGALSTSEEKVSYNLWEWYEEELDTPDMKRLDGLFFFMSKINHSCEPNVFPVRHDVVNEENKDYQGVFVLVATKFIPAGKELVISYGPETGHEDKHFLKGCSCWTDRKDRNREFNRTVKLANRHWKHAQSYYLNKIYPNIYKEKEDVDTEML